MKKFASFLLAIAAVFTFSFAAVAATSIKTETKPPINFFQTKASPVAPATVAVHAVHVDFTDVHSEFPGALTINKIFNTNDPGERCFSSNQILFRQSETATAIDFVSPPRALRMNFNAEFMGLRGVARIEPTLIDGLKNFRSSFAFRPDKRFSKNNFGVTLNRLFVARA